jgi:hypothetical protein
MKNGTIPNPFIITCGYSDAYGLPPLALKILPNLTLLPPSLCSSIILTVKRNTAFMIIFPLPTTHLNLLPPSCLTHLISQKVKTLLLVTLRLIPLLFPPNLHHFQPCLPTIRSGHSTAYLPLQFSFWIGPIISIHPFIGLSNWRACWLN